MPDGVKLQYNGQDFELPVVHGTEDERAIDIGKLRADTGLCTLDEGYANTASTMSAVTFLDGESGVLQQPCQQPPVALVVLHDQYVQTWFPPLNQYLVQDMAHGVQHQMGGQLDPPPGVY